MANDMVDKLLEFVEASKSKGASDEFLGALLARRGWPQEDVYAALGRYWERQTGMAIPVRSAGGESSRDAFLYLLSFSTLATWAGALGSMLFRFIEHWLPDPVLGYPYYYNLRSVVNWQMASIAVAFPIFVLVMRTILREAQDRPERLQSGVRKWLTYIALLITAGAMICDLIWFLNYFLNGELTGRFVLKALTVMLICGAIFFYYLGSLRWDRDTNVALVRSRSLKFGIGSAVAVVAAFAVGLGLAGTPAAQRRIEADEKRVQNLHQLASSIYDWYQRLGRPAELPARLDDMLVRGAPRDQMFDPETKVPFEYHVKSGTMYELCANFSDQQDADPAQQTQFWFHGKGRTCFTLDASKAPAW